MINNIIQLEMSFQIFNSFVVCGDSPADLFLPNVDSMATVFVGGYSLSLVKQVSEAAHIGRLYFRK